MVDPPPFGLPMAHPPWWGADCYQWLCCYADNDRPIGKFQTAAGAAESTPIPSHPQPAALLRLPMHLCAEASWRTIPRTTNKTLGVHMGWVLGFLQSSTSASSHYSLTTAKAKKITSGYHYQLQGAAVAWTVTRTHSAVAVSGVVFLTWQPKGQSHKLAAHCNINIPPLYWTLDEYLPRFEIPKKFRSKFRSRLQTPAELRSV
jgi:hypothetical protein